MAFTLLDALLLVVMVVVGDWLTFARCIDVLSGVTERGRRSYRDYFFPRILFVVAGGILIAHAASDGPGAFLVGGLGIAIVTISHLIQYYWFFTD